MKKCIKCDERFPVEHFLRKWNAQRGKHYLTGTCRACRSKKSVENYDYKDKQASAKRERYNADPEYRRKLLSDQHKYRMGITLDEKEAMLAAQGGMCASCGEAETKGHGWQTDHDHSCCPGHRSCGKCIRGIICQSCNLTIGQAGESIERLESIIKYLQRQTALRLQEAN